MYGKVIDPERIRIAEALEKFVRVRRTIRSYLPDPVPRDVAERIINAGLAAPTKNNQVRWEMRVIDHESPVRAEFLKRLRFSYSYLSDIKALYESGYLDLDRYQGFVKSFMESLEEIPVFAVMVAERPPSTLPAQLYQRELAHTLASCGFAAENMLLVALAWGVGGGILTLVSDEAEAALLDLLGFLRDAYTVAMILTFGYPKEVPKPPHKDTVVKWL